MAYAPHTNNDVQQQLVAGLIPTPAPIILGSFSEHDYGHTFEYAERRGFPDDLMPHLPHIVYVGHGETRLAIIHKTVAYVLVDDNQLERWQICRHHIYDTQWIRA